MIRFAKSIFAGERGRSCRRAQATSAITRSDVVCHFWRSNAPKSSVRRPSRTFSIRHSTRSLSHSDVHGAGCRSRTMTFSCSLLCGVDMVCYFAGLPSTNRVLQARFSRRPWRAAAAAERHQITSVTHTYAQLMPHPFHRLSLASPVNERDTCHHWHSTQIRPCHRR